MTFATPINTNSSRKVLVVDDESAILEAVAYNLRKEGFRVKVAMNAEAAMRAFREDEPDLLILDVMLPSASGFQICKTIRSTHDTPIIMLTACAEERNKVQGLELGADDYMTKPFSVAELIARVRALLRRTDVKPGADRITVGNLEIDTAKHEATIGGAVLTLAPKEFALLEFLARNPDIAFSRATLLDRVWGRDAFVEERTIDVHVRWLRSKIETDPASPNRIVTVRGIGYKLNSAT